MFQLSKTIATAAAATILLTGVGIGSISTAEHAAAAQVSPTLSSSIPIESNKSHAAAVKIILNETNAARKAKGLKPLKLDTGTSKVAQTWSKRMGVETRMYHNPNYAKQIPKGWSRAAENVAMGYSRTAVVDAWLKSPGHRANILTRDFTHIGIGYYVDSKGRTWFTQNFATYPTTGYLAGPSKVAVGAVKSYKVVPAAGAVTASWAKPTVTGKVANYMVTVKQGTKTVKSYSTTSLSKKVTGLKKKTTYKVYVKANAKSSNGVYAKSSSWSVKTVKTK